ncbi:MAG TPA: host-nuclease inhibitor Gam family protein [Chthonomonadaceae bacterium]|nr:host-nuclease inhibitor Gam family protein [Chthonomonadaceae bacterium]
MSAETIPVQAEEAAPVAVPVVTESLDTRFHINSDVAANWLLSKLASIDAEIQRVTAQAAIIVKQLEADRDSLLYLYEAELSAFVSQKIAESGGRRRSVHFLQGSCGFRRVPAHVSVKDTGAALLHAKEAGLPAVVTVEKLDAAAYREIAEARMSADGTALPGCEVVPETDRFSIKFPGAKAED